MELKRPKMTNPVHFLAFGFGSGLAPIAPGTFGTLAAMPIWWLCAQLPLWGYLLVTALVIAVGPFLCGKTSHDMHVHDHPGIVWDEIAGLLITMIAVPVTWWGRWQGLSLSGCSTSSSPGPLAGWTVAWTAAWGSWWMTCWPGCMRRWWCNY